MSASSSGTAAEFSTSASSSGMSVPKRRKVVAELATLGASRVGTVRMLQTLVSEGLLTEPSFAQTSARTLRNDARLGVADAVANVRTPYGPVLTKVAVGDIEIEAVNPFAYLHLLCERSKPLCDVLCPGGVNTCRSLVMYIDEVRPGNPLRPDKCRQTQCVYWTFSDFPDKLLTSDATWFLATAVRSTIVAKMPATVSGLMRALLNMFFAPQGTSWSRGIVVMCGNDAALLTAKFSGFLGDEKALKEILSLKGASGTRPCATCANVVQFMKPSGCLVGIDCIDSDRFVRVTDSDFYVAADRLKAHRGSNAALSKLEQITGIKYDAAAMIYDEHLRSFVLPITHYLRDWMHTLVGHGTAGTEIALAMHALAEQGLRNHAITTYVSVYTLPKNRGKLDIELFSEHKLGGDNMRAFASEALTMIPLMNAFMQDVAKPLGILPDHIRSFELLTAIVDLLKLGPTAAAERSNDLRRLVQEHHETFLAAYGSTNVKPKWHHMLHLHEHGSTVGRMLSCFVTERKHKSVKSAATWAFNQYENTVLRTLLYRQVNTLSDDMHFASECLVKPQSDDFSGTVVRRSTVASLRCGDVHKGDIVVCVGHRVMEVVFFLDLPGTSTSVYWQGKPLNRYGDSRTTWSRQPEPLDLVYLASDIVSPVPWAHREGGLINIVPPTFW
jgi:hypothetical protein